MGNKKLRNRERNIQKMQARKLAVDEQNSRHDAALYGRVLIDAMRRKRADEKEMLRELILHSLAAYVKIPPELAYAEICSTESGTFQVVLCAKGSVDVPDFVEINRTREFTVWSTAHLKALPDIPVVALKDVDGSISYPYFDERKGRVLEEARQRRERKKKRRFAHAA